MQYCRIDTFVVFRDVSRQQFYPETVGEEPLKKIIPAYDCYDSVRITSFFVVVVVVVFIFVVVVVIRRIYL